MLSQSGRAFQTGSGFEKALWVAGDRITTRAAIDDLLADSVGWNVRDLVVQVRGRGDAYYAGRLEPRALGLPDDPFDALAHLVRAGAAVGVRIHAWANACFVWSSPGQVPPWAAGQIVNAHPDWLLRPIGAAASKDAAARDGVRYLDPSGGADWEGIYLDPTSAEARLRTVVAFTDIVTRYAVEGFHYAYIRYPQASYAGSPEDHRAVTALVHDAAAALRRARPGVVLSAAVFPDPAVARDRVLQRWPEWAAAGMLDLLCPMAYRPDTREVARLLSLARDRAPATRMWGGLMAYPGERERVRAQVRVARDSGCEGAILFAYDPAHRDVIDTFALEAER